MSAVSDIKQKKGWRRIRKRVRPYCSYYYDARARAAARLARRRTNTVQPYTTRVSRCAEETLPPNGR